MPWRTIEGEDLAPPAIPQLKVLLSGVFEKRRFLDLLRHFIVFEDQGGGVLIKKMAGYHQFHAVRGAVEATVKAALRDRRCGWSGYAKVEIPHHGFYMGESS
jgi:type I restriction enzyme R subunit